ncbi:Ferredoxin [Smithella sp. ME-1]|uniref:Ferredoxin n=1 Tax=hydrocarbon metagenome TaxID=938273 RepID=A0A0W8FM51_9ZZZZ|nr:Ferredoxin [Smithella sp. ME-1]
METTIYFYTGTGNSFWTAKKLSGTLGNTELIPIPFSGDGSIRPDSEKVGLIFPVHIWGVPTRVVAFLNRLETDSPKYYFAVAVNAGQVAATLIQLKMILKEKNINLAAGFSICMPSNYIPWGGAISPEKQQRKFEEALVKIQRIAASIRAKEERAPEKGPAWQNIFFSAIYRLSFPKVPEMDKAFWVDEKCSSCMICEKICPSQNISITGGKPIWQNHCEQCFACLQWCPEEAIQYGKGTTKKKRYHHPEIKLSDMLNSIPKRNA